MTVDFRAFEDAELRAAFELGRLSFGGPRLAETDPLPQRPGRVMLGAFEGDRLLAMVGDRAQEQWYGGKLVPACGIASVAVAAGERSKGYSRRLLELALASARERGAVVSTLFPTTPGFYRRLGWEMAGVISYWDFPTAALARLRVPDGSSTRPAEPGDVEGILAVYGERAARSNGYLERSTARFPEWPFHPEYGLDGVTVATGDGGVVDGFTAWERSGGIGSDALLTVHDLHPRTPAATTALLSSIGSWEAVVPTATILLPRPDPAWWMIPAGLPNPRHARQWMIRLVDVRGAVAARGWPANIDVSVDIEVVDGFCPWNAGPLRVTVAEGVGSAEPGGSGRLVVDVRALSVLYAGGVSVGMLREVGLVSGGSAADDAALDAMTAGPAPTTVNSF